MYANNFYDAFITGLQTGLRKTLRLVASSIFFVLLSQSAFSKVALADTTLSQPAQHALTQFIPASHPALLYSGRIDTTDTNRPYLSWPGSSVSFKFTGAKLVLRLTDDKGLNYYNVIFNHQDAYPYVLAAQKGTHEYDLSHMIEKPVTEVTLFKRTEGEEGGSYIGGLILQARAKLLTPTPLPQRRIAFFGDSVTVGMGNEAAHNAPDNNPAEKNHYLSYAAIAARDLNAEFHSIAKSGIGVLVSWFDFTMPAYFDQLRAESNNDSKWDFSQWQPHVVVVNLLQNDSWLIDNEKRLNATPAEISQAYYEFIQTLRSKHPDAHFICALGSMDITRDNQWPGYVTQAIKQIKQQDAGAKIDQIEFDYTGYGAHPRVEQHLKNAKKLSAFIRQKTAWSDDGSTQ